MAPNELRSHGRSSGTDLPRTAAFASSSTGAEGSRRPVSQLTAIVTLAANQSAWDLSMGV